MDLSIALQQLHQLMTAWQTPLLFLVVQLLVVLIFLREKKSSAPSEEEAAEQQRREEEQQREWWASLLSAPSSQLTRLPSFKRSATASSLANAAALALALQKWARRSAAASRPRPHERTLCNSSRDRSPLHRHVSKLTS